MSAIEMAYQERSNVQADKKEALKELSKAMVHAELPLTAALGYYRKMTTRWNPAVQHLGKEGFQQFLSVLAFFLKAETKERGEMKRFKRVSEKKPSTRDLAEKEAMELFEKLDKAGEANVNKNKLKRLGARLSASRDPYEALAHLARFYPLKGVPKEVIDHLVEKLGELELESFKNLYALGLRFYEAKLEGWEG